MPSSTSPDATRTDFRSDTGIKSFYPTTTPTEEDPRQADSTKGGHVPVRTGSRIGAILALLGVVILLWGCSGQSIEEKKKEAEEVVSTWADQRLKEEQEYGWEYIAPSDRQAYSKERYKEQQPDPGGMMEKIAEDASGFKADSSRIDGESGVVFGRIKKPDSDKISEMYLKAVMGGGIAQNASAEEFVAFLDRNDITIPTKPMQVDVEVVKEDGEWYVSMGWKEEQENAENLSIEDEKVRVARNRQGDKLTGILLTVRNEGGKAVESVQFEVDYEDQSGKRVARTYWVRAKEKGERQNERVYEVRDKLPGSWTGEVDTRILAAKVDGSR